jgi:hypothetical protein
MTHDTIHRMNRVDARAGRIGRGLWPSRLLVMCMAGIAVLSHAQDAMTSEQSAARTGLIEERARRIQEIGRERTRIQEQENRESAQCYQHFVVNSCVQAAADRHRKSLTALRREETAINNAEREREGQEQRARIASQEQADRDKNEQASVRGAGAPTQEQRQQAAQDQQRRQEAERPARAQQGAAQQQRKELERAEAQRQRAQKAEEAPAQASRFDAKQREAQARREERDRRLQERAAKGAAGKPVPQALPAP